MYRWVCWFVLKKRGSKSNTWDDKVVPFLAAQGTQNTRLAPSFCSEARKVCTAVSSQSSCSALVSVKGPGVAKPTKRSYSKLLMKCVLHGSSKTALETCARHTAQAMPNPRSLGHLLGFLGENETHRTPLRRKPKKSQSKTTNTKELSTQKIGRNI